MIKFTKDNLKQEFEILNPRLQNILFWLDGFLSYRWNLPLTLTHLLRTQAQQEAIYGKGTLNKSVHQFGRGADISVKEFIAQEIDPAVIAEEVNRNFPYAKPGFKTALYHSVGDHGRHLHIQVAESV